jgi:hypothetical protein
VSSGLAEALNFAVHRNRNYLLQKEVVYLKPRWT